MDELDLEGDDERGLSARAFGVEAVLEWPPLELLWGVRADSNMEMSSVARPGGGSVLSLCGSVEERECREAELLFARRADRLRGSAGDAVCTRAVEKAAEDGRVESSVTSVILLNLTRASENIPTAPGEEMPENPVVGDWEPTEEFDE